MVWRRAKVFLSALALTMLCASSISAKPAKSRGLPEGLWGGPDIQITVERNQATIEYGCAHGTINGPLTLNSRGVFKWRGFHTRERGGPIRINEKTSQLPALYTGSVKGSTLTLTVKLAGTGETLGTFILTRGKASRIFKCL